MPAATRRPVQARSRTGLRDLLPLAESHGGLFATQQAHEVGVSDRMLAYYVKRGDLERLARGVYRVVYLPLHRHQDVILACLWVGGSAVASHETALTVYGLTDSMPAVVHVTAPTRFRGKRGGVTIHRELLPDADRASRNDVPVTSVPRTLYDVAGRDWNLAGQALREALDRGETSTRRIQRAARRYSILAELVRTGAHR